MEIFMNTIRSVEASSHVGQRVRLTGWLHNVRRLGGVSFVVLRDGWGTIQAVTESEADLAPIADLRLESVISLTGVIVATPQAPGVRDTVAGAGHVQWRVRERRGEAFCGARAQRP